MRRLALLLAMVVALPATVAAAEPVAPPGGTAAPTPAAPATVMPATVTAAAGTMTDADGIAFFEKRIRPALVEHCYECHANNPQKLRGNLRLDTRDALLSGGDSGPAIVPGKPDDSLLIQAIRYESFEMPPDGKLPPEVVADFVQWIERGAPDPRRQADGDASHGSERRDIDLAAGREFWAFRKPAAGVPPQPRDRAWPRSGIDRFILSALDEAGLEPGPDASREVLLRRATYDLTGLPPAPEEIRAFVADKSPDAFVRVVDRLLESPHFGERWGRHWLDVARYADTTGGGRSLFYKEAWRYRDYIIQSFNADLPYDRLIVEQLAGDLLPYDDFRQGQSQVVATAFLVLGASNYENQDKGALRMDVVDEQLDTLGRTFLGLTIGCARCHDHKFDPIPQADYYALAGILRSTQSLVNDNVSSWVKRPLPVDPATQARVDAYRQALAALESELARCEKSLKTLRDQTPVVTVDNEAAKFTGEWQTGKTDREFVGADYRYATAAGASARYEFSLTHPGLYEVRVSYSPHPGRSAAAKVVVADASGDAVYRVDQRMPPPLEGLYVSLGPHRLGQRAVVEIASTDASGPVVADAVQLVPLFGAPRSGGRIVADPSTLPGVVVDDVQAEITGVWTSSTSVKSYVGAGYIHDDRQGKGVNAARFRADLPTSGEYEVRLSYTHSSSRAPRVPVKVTHAGGDSTAYIDQRQEPDVDGLFGVVGRYPFHNDQTAVVSITTEGTENGHVIVDAVQFVPIAPLAVAGSGSSPTESSTPAETQALVAKFSQLEAEQGRIKSELADLKKNAPPLPPEVLSVRDEPQIADCPLHIRGNHKNLGAPVPRGFLQVARPAAAPAPDLPPDQSGRLQLAHWIASPDNPLTARVMVNRIWSHLFGAGLVRTVDNFGVPGERPSHPELLDFLALRFVEEGWSVKQLIREIVCSRTYQLASTPLPSAAAVDPDNRLLAFQNRRRLEAEAIYDSILTLSGGLDRTIGGNTIRDGTKSEYAYTFDDGRRAVYMPVFRNRLHDLLSAFDYPDPNTPQGRRNVSTLATQALYLMNSPLVMDQSARAADRLLALPDTGDASRLERLYLAAFGRPPGHAERAIAAAHLSSAGSAPEARRQAWTQLCQALIGSVDFRYVE